MVRKHRLGTEVGKYPRDIISKHFIVSTDSALWVLFLEDLNPPIHKHDDIEDSVDVRGKETIPPSLDFARDFGTLERPPGGLDSSPPSKDRVHKVQEASPSLCIIREACRAGRSGPSTDLSGSIGSGE